MGLSLMGCFPSDFQEGKCPQDTRGNSPLRVANGTLRRGNGLFRLMWADPGVLWKKAPRAIRAMRGKTLQTVPFKGISTVIWVHQRLPRSTVSQAFSSNKSYESKAGCNRTPATVLWVPLIMGCFRAPPPWLKRPIKRSMSPDFISSSSRFHPELVQRPEFGRQSPTIT